MAESAEAEHEYGVSLTAWDKLPRLVPWSPPSPTGEYAEMGVAKLCDKLVPNGVFNRREELLRPG